MTMMLSTVALLSTSGLQSAWAMPGPNVGLASNPVALNGIQTVTLSDNSAMNFDPPHRGSIWMIDPDSTLVLPFPPNGGFINLPADCTGAGFTLGGTGTVWELQDGSGNPAVYETPVGGGLISFEFGHGDGTANPSPGTNMISTGPHTWVAIQGADSDSLAKEGTYNIGLCGNDEHGLDQQTTPPGSPKGYSFVSGFDAQRPVGGTILSINTTSLLIGGLMSSSMMVLPAIGIAAAVLVTVLKLQKKF